VNHHVLTHFHNAIRQGYRTLQGVVRKVLTCRETSDHSILEGFPTVHVFSMLPTEVFGRHVVQA